MKRLAGILVLVFLVVNTAHSQMVTVTRDVNLRPDPSTDNPAIAELTPPAQLRLLDPDPTNGFFHVQTSTGQEGWVWGHNIQIPEALPPSASSGFPTSASTFIRGVALVVIISWLAIRALRTRRVSGNAREAPPVARANVIKTGKALESQDQASALPYAGQSSEVSSDLPPPADGDIDSPKEWPIFNHPERLFSLQLPRGWKEIPPLSRDAAFAAVSLGGRVLLEILVAESGASRNTGFDLIAAVPKVILESLGSKHPDVREVWKSEIKKNSAGACRRLILEYTDQIQPAAGGTGHFTTDYFFLGGESRVLFANFKVLTCEYRHWAGLFERIARGISVRGLGRIEIVARTARPIAARSTKPADWVTCYLDPIQFSYPPEWKEMPPQGPRERSLLVLSGPSGATVKATVCDQQEWFFNGLLELPSSFVDDFECDDVVAELVWEGEAAKANRGRCIRVVVKLPQVQPPSMRDFIVMGGEDRVLILQLAAPSAHYKEMAAVFAEIARTGVVGPLGPFDIGSVPDAHAGS